MGARIKFTTIVNGVVYAAGAEVPDDVAAQITNPDVLQGPPSEDVDLGGLPAGLKLSEDGVLLNWQGEDYVRLAAVEAAEPAALAVIPVLKSTAADAAEQAPPPPATDGPVEPPRSGPGSGIEAWRKYASTLQHVEIPDGAGRDEIIAAVDAAK